MGRVKPGTDKAARPSGAAVENQGHRKPACGQPQCCRIGSFRSAGDNGTADNPAGYNLVIFPAGLGDGVYATWAGLDSHDHPICLLTNFALTDQIS